MIYDLLSYMANITKKLSPVMRSVAGQKTSGAMKAAKTGPGCTARNNAEAIKTIKYPNIKLLSNALNIACKFINSFRISQLLSTF